MRNNIMQVSGFVRALVVGAAFVVAAASLPGTSALAAEKEKTQQPSAKLAKPLHDAQEAIKAKNFPAALAKLKEADAMSPKTPWDQHLINDMMGYAQYKVGDMAAAAKAWEAEVDDGQTPPAELAQRTKALTELHYNLKNFDKAIEYGNRAIKGGFADDAIRTLIAQSYYLKGDWKNTLKFEEGIVDGQIKAGETPKNESLMLIYSACQKMNDDACSTKAVERLVTYYPKPDYWSQLLFSLRNQTGNNDANTLETYRLMLEVDVLKQASDFNEMAQLALEAGSPGEAQTVLEKGFAKNVFTDKLASDRNKRLLDNAKKAAANDQAQLPKLEKDAETGTTGAKNAGVGLAYLGYGQYDKAVDQLSKGLTKGGLKNEAETRLQLGIAQLKAGKKDEAVKSFRAVKGDPVLERLANLWVLHARQA